jgi:hypothetical protein
MYYISLCLFDEQANEERKENVLGKTGLWDIKNEA